MIIPHFAKGIDCLGVEVWISQSKCLVPPIQGIFIILPLDRQWTAPCMRRSLPPQANYFIAQDGKCIIEFCREA